MSEENNLQEQNQLNEHIVVSTMGRDSERNWGTCFLLFLFLGWLGAHRFYVGKIGTAILYIITLGGAGIWAIVDFIAIFTGNLKDKEGNVVRRKLDGSKQKSEKSWGTCFLLFLFLGCFGAHRFYAGKIGTAILYIFTFGGVGIWALVDLISIVFGNFTDKEGKFII